MESDQETYRRQFETVQRGIVGHVQVGGLEALRLGGEPVMFEVALDGKVERMDLPTFQRLAHALAALADIGGIEPDGPPA